VEAEVAALMDTVLLFGHSGRIGRVLQSYLLAKGWDVVGASTADCDLLDEDRCAAFFDALRGESHVVMASVINRSVENSPSAMTRNIAMMRNLCAQLSLHPPKSLVLLSTVDVYGTSPPLPVNEDSRLAPSSYYALGKLACEFLPGVINRRAFPVTTLRLPGVYGSRPDEASIVAGFLRILADGGTVTIHGDGSVLRDFVHVADVCEIVRRVLETPQEGVFNIATGESLTLLDIVAQLAAAVGETPRLECDGPDHAAAASLVFDTRRLRQALPGLTFTPLQEGAARLAAQMTGRAHIQEERT
jgi:nucleoside-diphosphate-sugar epimerase